MSAANLTVARLEMPEWRRSGPFLLLAAVLHAAALAWPLGWLLRPVDIPPPGPLRVQLVDNFHPAAIPAPQPVVKPEPRPAPTHTAPPRHAPRPSSPVIQMAPEQQPVAAATPTVAPAVAPPQTAAPEPARAAAPTGAQGNPQAALPVSAARYNAAYLNNPEPKYPLLSRRLGEEGKVLLKVRVTVNGTAASVELEKSSNFERLDEAARQAVAHWRFVPARRGDEPVEASVIVPIVFRLDS